MIPDMREETWTTTTTRTSAAVASGGPAATQQTTTSGEADCCAWTRYKRFVEAMQSRGLHFDRGQVLDAMFRGGDLAYSAVHVARGAS